MSLANFERFFDRSATVFFLVLGIGAAIGTAALGL